MRQSSSAATAVACCICAEYSNNRLTSSPLRMIYTYKMFYEPLSQFWSQVLSNFHIVFAYHIYLFIHLSQRNDQWTVPHMYAIYLGACGLCVQTQLQELASIVQNSYLHKILHNFNSPCERVRKVWEQNQITSKRSLWFLLFTSKCSQIVPFLKFIFGPL